MAKFSIEQAVGFGWKTVKENWTTLIPVVTLLLVANGLVDSLIRHGEPSYDFMTSTNYHHLVSFTSGHILSTIISVIFSAIVIRVCLQYVDGKAKDLASLFKGITPELLVKVILASVLVNIIVGIGFLLLVIPGVYLALRYGLVTYVLVDRNLGIMEAFTESARLTEGVKWQLILFALICVMLAILGAVVLVIGLVVAIPVIMVAFAHVYRQLSKSAGKVEA